MKALLNIRFIGSAYRGYQVQGEEPTVQRALNMATMELFGFACDIIGCSRTDAGVHAKMFCATVSKHGQNDLPTDLSVDRLPRALNSHLPSDISVVNACFVPDSFHPRYQVIEKEYEYRFLFSPVRDPFEEGRAWHIPHTLCDGMVEKMNLAASFWIGKHDFSSYMAQGSKIKDTTRTVLKSFVVRQGSIYIFHISADGFLYNMVRIMAGTLSEVALGRRLPESISDVTKACNRARAGLTAPAHGLYLARVHYDLQNVLPGDWEIPVI